MNRRAFMSLLGGAAAATWPLMAHTQDGDRVRRLAILLPGAENDRRYQEWVRVFLRALADLGWTAERNIRVDSRYATASPVEIRKYAAELLALGPDLILAHGASTVGPLLQMNRTVPIVFPIVADPVAAGFVDSLAKPGGNVTGFMTAEYGVAGKWLELLREIAPSIARTAVLRDPAIITGASQFAAIQAVSAYVRMVVSPVNVRDASRIEHDVAEFARAPGGSLLVTSGPGPQQHRDLIVTLAARHKLPTVYPERFYVTAGGLMSYGVDYLDQYRRAAGYVDRILRGEKPADLPVQAPTKYELAINMKTAKALGIDVPPTLLARADEVLE
jgi:putative tryptophan/tyrosine transport system substrate-binding protein